MPHVITTKSVVVGTPLFDDKQKPVMEEVKFGNRKVTHHVHDHVQHEAGSLIEVNEATAKELIDGGHAREHIAGLDAEDTVDPTLSGADPLA